MNGKLLRHRRVQPTNRYVHLERDSVKASASRTGASVGTDILMNDVAANSL